MLLNILLLFEVVMVAVFFLAYFKKDLLLWAMTLILSGTLAMQSWHIEFVQHDTLVTTYSGVLGAWNILFFAVALILGVYDMFGGGNVKPH